MAADLREQLIGLLEPELKTLGYELVELEFKGRGGSGLLRIYIDAPDGVGLDDCSKVSRQARKTAVQTASSEPGNRPRPMTARPFALIAHCRSRPAASGASSSASSKYMSLITRK